tara:strand:+ start:3940 stop:4599 length:660 start_codon:yes stop_codon:yes gene_type:complete
VNTLSKINSDLTKREILSILKENNVSSITVGNQQKRPSKCTKQQLVDFANPAPDVVVETEDVVVVAEVSETAENALEIDAPASEGAPIIDMESPVVAELLEQAKKAGKQKKKSGPKGSWVARIDALLQSSANRQDDGSYFFTIEQAAELMSVPVTLTPFRYSTDWHPSYKGAGRACVQRSFKGRLRLSQRQPETTGVYLTPLSPEEAQALMDKYNYKPI